MTASLCDCVLPSASSIPITTSIFTSISNYIYFSVSNFLLLRFVFYFYVVLPPFVMSISLALSCLLFGLQRKPSPSSNPTEYPRKFTRWRLNYAYPMIWMVLSSIMLSPSTAMSVQQGLITPQPFGIFRRAYRLPRTKKHLIRFNFPPDITWRLLQANLFSLGRNATSLLNLSGRFTYKGMGVNLTPSCSSALSISRHTTKPRLFLSRLQATMIFICQV